MKNKHISKRQILLGVCCLLFFAGIVCGALLSIKNDVSINFSSGITDTTFIKEFFKVFKFSVLALLFGTIPETHVLLYFLVAFKGFSIGYTAFAVAEKNIMERMVLLFSFVPAEFAVSLFIILCLSYFSLNKKVEYLSKGYRQYCNKRKTEIFLLIIAGIFVSFVCALWKISAVYLLYKT